MAQPSTPQTETIVFFDGVCHLCNGFVDFAIARDRHRRLRFAPLQGETAKRLLPDTDRARLESVVLSHDGRLFRESAAVLEIFRLLGGGLGLLGALGKIVPAFLRDPLYRFVARRRRKWFGERDACRLPTPEERGRLLD